MTDKQEKILQAALELFAKEGFNATSTNKVAKRAEVSEGLIFRHFKNKEGLLEAILKEGEERAKLLFSDIVFETEPKEVIRKTLEISDKILSNEEDKIFWKLQYKIKWEIEQYNEQKMQALELALTSAFSKLTYSNPKEEARLLLIILDGLATRFFLQKNFEYQSIIEFLKLKYSV